VVRVRRTFGVYRTGLFVAVYRNSRLVVVRRSSCSGTTTARVIGGILESPDPGWTLRPRRATQNCLPFEYTGARVVGTSAQDRETQRNAVIEIGSFVLVQGSREGVGRLADVKGGTAIVEYFLAPNGPQLVRREVPLAEVRRAELSGQTCVFWHEPRTGQWRRGLVDGGRVPKEALHADEDHYDIRFPNQFAVRIPQSELYVRWAHPIEDPLDYLVARATDSPYYFQGRQALVAHLAEQRAALEGATALASSLIDLYPHQISAVRRILADPIQRYLLADEVGLGKTIEAGVLIRQHTIDQPDSQVLVVVPNHLQDQWQHELARFFPRLDQCGVLLATEGYLVSRGVPAGEYGMLVVDEAHRAASRAFSGDSAERVLYERLRTLARQAPAVLLLSGTPVLHQEDGFLAMLHLLDPHAYPLQDREGFRRRVKDRGEVAQCVAELSPDAPPLLLEETVDRLDRLFADDAVLRQRCALVRTLQGEGGERFAVAVRGLRRHVVESYRLHRRMVRTRRDDPRLENLLPRRSGIGMIPCDDLARRRAARFLENWHSQAGAVAQVASELYAGWVEASLSGPTTLAKRIRDRISRLAVTSKSGAVKAAIT
jgi:ATP-dependent helicase HepA